MWRVSTDLNLDERVDYVIKEWDMDGMWYNRSVLEIPISYILFGLNFETNFAVVKELLERGYNPNGGFIRGNFGNSSPLVAVSNAKGPEYNDTSKHSLIRLLIDYGAKVEPGQHYDDEYVHQYAEEKRLKDNKKKDQQLALVWSLKPLLPKDLINQILDEMK